MACPGSLTRFGDIWLESVAAWDEAQWPKARTLPTTLGYLLSSVLAFQVLGCASWFRVALSGIKGNKPDSGLLCSSSYMVGRL